jgi:hypothetical protein
MNNHTGVRDIDDSKGQRAKAEHSSTVYPMYQHLPIKKLEFCVNLPDVSCKGFTENRKGSFL